MDERWFHDVKPLLQQHTLLEDNSAVSPQVIAASSIGDSSASTKAVANEVKNLSTQIKALQETMEDLYETVFTSKLGKKD